MQTQELLGWDWERKAEPRAKPPMPAWRGVAGEAVQIDMRSAYG